MVRPMGAHCTLGVSSLTWVDVAQITYVSVPRVQLVALGVPREKCKVIVASDVDIVLRSGCTLGG